MTIPDASEDSTPATDQWRFPAPIGGPPPEEPKEPDYPYVFLREATVEEARVICARLESEGIPCSLHRASDASATTEDSRIEIHVREPEIALANEALARDAEVDPEEEEFDRTSDEEYAKNYVCPKCRTRTLELLPISSGWRTIRRLCLAIFLIPFVAAFLCWVIPDKTFAAMIDSFDSPGLITTWALVVLVLVGSLAVIERDKRCSKCGWETGDS